MARALNSLSASSDNSTSTHVHNSTTHTLCAGTNGQDLDDLPRLIQSRSDDQRAVQQIHGNAVGGLVLCSPTDDSEQPPHTSLCTHLCW